MKTFDKKDVFSWSNAEDAKQYLRKPCYFANDLQTLQSNIDVGLPSYLDVIDVTLCTSINHTFTDHMRTNYYGLCLPADKVKDVEDPKKWRAFTLEEFLNKFSIGTKIYFRRKDETKSVYGLFEGYQTDVERIIKYQIIICNLWYTLKELFENYEYLDEHGDWQPFGVLDES